MALLNGRLPPAELPQGTLTYCSPEQLHAEQELDVKSDIYALGITLYRCLSGVLPFPQTDRNELIGAILRGDKPSVSEVSPDLAPGLAHLIDRCCAVNPEERPPHPKALIDLFEALSQQYATTKDSVHQPRFGLRLSASQRGGIIEIAPNVSLEKGHEALLFDVMGNTNDRVFKTVFAEGSISRPWTRRLIIPNQNFVPTGWGSNNVWGLAHRDYSLELDARLLKGEHSTQEQRQQLSKFLSSISSQIAIPDRLIELIGQSERFDDKQLLVANGKQPIAGIHAHWSVPTNQSQTGGLRQGDIFGHFKATQEPVDGADVYGSPLRALREDGFCGTAHLGEGISEQHSAQPPRLIAQQNGCAQACLDGWLHVVPYQLVQAHDLTGLSEYRCDDLLVISGDIPPGIRIFSKLGVVIDGSIHNASIESLGDIHISGDVVGHHAKITSGAGIRIGGSVTGAHMQAWDIYCSRCLYYADTLAAHSLVAECIRGGLVRCAGIVQCNVAGSYYEETTSLLLVNGRAEGDCQRIDSLHQQWQTLRQERLEHFYAHLVHNYESMSDRSRRFHRQASSALTDLQHSIQRIRQQLDAPPEHGTKLVPTLAIERLAYPGVRIARGDESLRDITQCVAYLDSSCDGGYRGRLVISSDDQDLDP